MEPMLTDREIVAITDEIARANLKANFERVLVEPAVDSLGNDALRVTIVIKPGAVDRIQGDTLLDMLTQIQTRLLKQSESRFPIVEYATEEELKAVGDS
jgi:hypothetical protein